MRVSPNGKLVATVNDHDKEELSEIAARFAQRGFEIYATGGTCKSLREKGIDATEINKINEESPHILDLIQSGEVDFVINTPTKGRNQNRDGFKIRRCAVERSIPCLTSLDTAKAMLLSISSIGQEEISVVNIAEIV